MVLHAQHYIGQEQWSLPTQLTSLPERIAQISIDTYHTLCPEHAANWQGQSVLATFVLESDVTQCEDQKYPSKQMSSLRVVSLGVGTKFLASGTAMSTEAAAGKLVMDSHAEVLSRRALLRTYMPRFDGALMQNHRHQTTLLCSSVAPMVVVCLPGMKAIYSHRPHLVTLLVGLKRRQTVVCVQYISR